MRAPRLLLAAGLLLLALPSPATAVEPNIYINRGEWLAHLTGDGSTGDGGGLQAFDVDETLDLDADQQVSSLDSFVRVGKSRFVISWNQVRYSGADRLKDDLVFDGDTYPAGGRLRSVLHNDRWRLLYGRPFLDTRKTALGFLAGIEDYRVEQDASMGGQPSNTVELSERVPVVGLSITWHPFPYARVYGEATGTSISRHGSTSRLLSAFVRAEYDLYANLLAISLDYRIAFMDVDEDREAEYELRHRGLAYGLTLKF